MRKTLLTFLLALAFSGNGQGLLQYFDYEYLPRADFAHYKELRFQWNFEGKLQSLFNAGLTDLKEENYIKAIGSFDEAIKEHPDHIISHYYRAIALKAVDSLDQALEELKFVLERSDEKSPVYYEMGEIYQHTGKFDKALFCYDKVRDLTPDKADGYFGVANVSFLQRQPEKAIRFYKKCNDVEPRFADAYLKIGLLKLATNNKEKQALSYFDLALQADSLFEEGLFWRGLINAEFGQYETAIKDWTRLLQLNPKHPYYLLVRGFLWIELNDFDKAFIDLKNAVLGRDINENRFMFGKTVLNKQIDLYSASQYLMRMIYGIDDDAAAPLKKAYCFMLAGKYRSALDFLNESISIQPFSCSYLVKGLAHEYLEEHEAAYAAYDEALKLDNEIFDAHKKRAIYRTQRREWKGAALDFIAMEKIQPESPVIYKLRGLLKYAQNDFYGAIIDLKRCIKTDSLTREVLEAYAISNFQVQNYEISKAQFRKLIRLDPNRNLIYENLYVNHLVLKDTTTALEVLEEYVKRFPDFPFSYIQKMEVYVHRKQFAKALETFTIFIRTPYYKPERNLSEALYLKGVAEIGSNDKEKALETFDEAISVGQKVDFENADAYYMRGKTYWELGKAKKAASDFRKLSGLGYSQNQEFIKKVLDSSK